MIIKKPTYIFDFDKTIVSVESLDILSDLCLAKNPKKNELKEKIALITEKGMNGEISFGESLRQRFTFLSPTREDIYLCAGKLKECITQSILRNRSFFKKNRKDIFIVSGGFKELIIPVASLLDIEESHVFANEIIDGTFNVSNPLAHTEGKVKVVKALKRDNVIVIGDGYTDAQIKELGAANYFVAFTENVFRKAIIKSADEVVGSLDEFLMNLHITI